MINFFNIETKNSFSYGRDASIIGEVIKDDKSRVYLKTSSGGSRIVDMLSGEQLPRIC